MFDIGIGHYLTLGAVIFTANKINSMLIRITITFFLFRKIPTTPIVKITAPRVK